MKRTFKIIVMAICLCSMLSIDSYGKSKTKRIVIFALDGISVEGFQTAKTPNLDQLILKEGSYSLTTRNQMPTVTMPNWTSHMTGSMPEQHCITDNNWKRDNIVVEPVCKDADGFYPSVFKEVKENYPESAIGFFYDWAWLIYPFNEKYLDKISYAENDDFVFNYNQAEKFILENKNKDTFLFLYTVHTDHNGHRHGWMSPEYIKAIEDVDSKIGEFIEMMKKEGLYDETYFFFLTDHGGIKRGHGKCTPVEMIVPWGVKGPGIKQGFEITDYNNTMNTAATILDIMKIKVPEIWMGRPVKSIYKRRRK